MSVSNSETGFGKYQVHLGILQGICFNLATVEESIAQVHLGRRLDTGLFSADTVRLETRAIVAKAKDVIRTGFDQQRFRALIERVRRSTTMEIQAPASAVGNLVDTSELFTEKDRDSLLGYFIKEYVPTAYGFARAVGRLAQDVDDPDRAFNPDPRPVRGHDDESSGRPAWGVPARSVFLRSWRLGWPCRRPARRSPSGFPCEPRSGTPGMIEGVAAPGAPSPGRSPAARLAGYGVGIIFAAASLGRSVGQLSLGA